MPEPAAIRARLTLRTVRLFYALSPVVFGAIALSVLWLRGTGVPDAFRAPASLTEQLLAGLLCGAVAGVVVGAIVIRAPRLAHLRALIREGFVSAGPRSFDLFLTSLSAGFSEEFLFRGALQPWLGIWLASLLFALAHGGGVKLSRGNLLFGLFIVCAGLYLGAIYAHFGLVASMATHFALDLTVLVLYRTTLARRPAGHTAES